MKIYLGSDHAGHPEKEALKKFLRASFPHLELQDVGTHSTESSHYPEYAVALCEKILEAEGRGEQVRGVLICGTGIGMCMVANKFQGIRAALCGSEMEARLSREHNDANVLCLGARTTPVVEMEKILHTWLETPGPEKDSRHAQRLQILAKLGGKI